MNQIWMTEQDGRWETGRPAPRCPAVVCLARACMHVFLSLKSKSQKTNRRIFRTTKTILPGLVEECSDLKKLANSKYVNLSTINWLNSTFLALDFSTVVHLLSSHLTQRLYIKRSHAVFFCTLFPSSLRKHGELFYICAKGAPLWK